MQTVSIILQIFGAFSGIGVLCVGIRWLYFKLCTKKLYYARKVYPISDRKYMHLISIWNPTYQTVSGNDITQSVCISMLGNEGNFYIIKYTDKCLIEKIKTIEKYHLQVDFSSFPPKSGFLMSYISDQKGTYIEGEIKNKNIEEVDYTKTKSLTFTPMIICILLYILSKMTELNMSLLGFVLCCYLVVVIGVYFVERYFYYPKMPVALWEAFRGKTSWY